MPRAAPGWRVGTALCAAAILVVFASPSGSTVASTSARTFRGEIVVMQFLGETEGEFHSRLFSVRSDGSGLRWHTSAQFAASNPSKSFNERSIAWEESGDICIVNADGGGRTCIDVAAYGRPRWSPDGKWIAYEPAAGDAGYRKNAIAIVSVDGRRKRMLPARRFIRSPDWSPNGRKFAFVAGPDAAPPIRNMVYTINVDGSGVKRVISFPRRDYIDDVRWSPDGRRLLVVTERGSVHVVNADGSGLRAVACSGLDASWSPDGQEIACTDGKRIRIVDVAKRRTRTLRLKACEREFCPALDW